MSADQPQPHEFEPEIPAEDLALASVLEFRPKSAIELWHEHFIGADDFVHDIRSPEWLIDGVIQRGYLYGLTAPTNHGKTALAAHLAPCVAHGDPFAGRRCERGHVLYMCGENPEDFKMRLRGSRQSMGLKAGMLNPWLTIMPKVSRLGDFIEPVKELASGSPLSLIIIDTNMAYFGYEDENANVDSKLQAQDCRLLMNAAGHPAVIVLCHPIKNASKDNLVPRGGSAFLNELDANLTLWKDGEVIELHHNKLRGPPFDPLQFRLAQCQIDGLQDTRGNPVTTIIAQAISDHEAEQMAEEQTTSAQLALRAMAKLPLITIAAVSAACNWTHKSRASRVMKTLQNEGFLIRELGQWTLTQKGKNAAK